MVEVLQVAVGASSAGGALHCSAGHSAICHVLPMLGLRGSGFACFFPTVGIPPIMSSKDRTSG